MHGRTCGGTHGDINKWGTRGHAQVEDIRGHVEDMWGNVWRIHRDTWRTWRQRMHRDTRGHKGTWRQRMHRDMHLEETRGHVEDTRGHTETHRECTAGCAFGGHV